MSYRKVGCDLHGSAGAWESMHETSYSLLAGIREQADTQAWTRLVAIYTPLLQSWLRRLGPLPAADVDDLVQEVLLAVSRDLPQFRPRPEQGGFRSWLRTVLVNRVRHFWRSRQHRPQAVGGSDFLEQLQKLEDGTTPLSQLWDREHDRHVLRQLLDVVQPRFDERTWLAFRRQMLDGVAAPAVATELAMPLHSVYAAKSRVLKALRTVAEGLVS